MKKTVKQIAVALLIGAVLIGCGGGSSSKDNEEDVSFLLDKTYQEKAGDSYTIASTIKVTYSNGEKLDKSYDRVKSYTEVDAIPMKYNYSNSIAKPYLLVTVVEDSEIRNLTYESSLGDTIIDDDLDKYTSVDFTTTSGSKEPENINIGDTFSFNEIATLFSSKTSKEIGEKTTDMKFTILSQEKITILAGEFDTVKMSYKFSEISTVEGIEDTYEGEINAWIDIEKGIIVKVSMDNTSLTLKKHDLTATFSYDSELKDYSISSVKNSKKLQKKTLINKINLDKVFADIRTRVDELRGIN